MEDVKKSHNVANNVAQRNSQDLTELWKKGKLEEYKKYYCKTKWFEDIFQARCYNKDTEDEWWVLKNERYNYNNVYHTNDIEVLAEVPDYIEWQKYVEANESMFTIVKMLNKDNYQLEKDIDKLKELLKECREVITNYNFFVKSIAPQESNLITKIDEALK